MSEMKATELIDLLGDGKSFGRLAEVLVEELDKMVYVDRYERGYIDSERAQAYLSGLLQAVFAYGYGRGRGAR